MHELGHGHDDQGDGRERPRPPHGRVERAWPPRRARPPRAPAATAARRARPCTRRRAASPRRAEARARTGRASAARRRRAAAGRRAPAGERGPRAWPRPAPASCGSRRSRRARRTSRRSATATVRKQPLGDLLVERQGEDEEPDVLVEQRIGDAEVAAGGARAAICCQSARTTLRPTTSPRRPRSPGTRPAGSAAVARCCDGRAGSRASRGAVRSTTQKLASRKVVVASPGEAGREPPAREERPEDLLLAELVEPQPLGLERAPTIRASTATIASAPSTTAERNRGRHHQRLARAASDRRRCTRPPCGACADRALEARAAWP